MSDTRKITQNVREFLDRAAIAYGKIKEEEFSQFIFCDLLERGMSSPIEDLFYIAVNLQCASSSISVNPTPDYDNKTGISTDRPGLFITPQARIGKYRVDFLLAYKNPDGYLPPVVIELDGHGFHDKDKHQRAYEKSRDRFLVKEGYKILHYTGSEVCADPHKVVYEALSTLGLSDYDAESLELFDPNNRMGRP